MKNLLTELLINLIGIILVCSIFLGMVVITWRLSTLFGEYQVIAQCVLFIIGCVGLGWARKWHISD